MGYLGSTTLLKGIGLIPTLVIDGEYWYLGLPYLFRVASDSIHTDRVKLVSWGAGRRLDDSSGSFGPMSY